MKQQSVSSILCGVIIGLLIFGAIFASLSTELAYAQLSGATAAYQKQQQLQRYQSSPSSSLSSSTLQTSQTPPSSSMPESSTLFESLKKGIRIQVPTGYVVEDPALPSQDIQKLFQLSGFSY